MHSKLPGQEVQKKKNLNQLCGKKIGFVIWAVLIISCLRMFTRDVISV